MFDHTLSRRFLLVTVAKLALSATMAPSSAGCRIDTGKREQRFPFKLGVASGDPLPTSVVLWTKFSPRPADPEYRPTDCFLVTWELALDIAFRHIVKTGVALAEPHVGHSVHAEVNGLWPGREYFYRFRYGKYVSAIGRTKTAPMVDLSNTSEASISPQRLRFAFASCSAFEEASYHSFEAIAGVDLPARSEVRDLDFILHLGDYIYERTYGQCPSAVKARCLENREDVQTLDQYRRRYAEYRQDKSLQAAHACAPWIVTWDDHEVANDYAANVPQHTWKMDSASILTFAERRKAAYQAYFENMPLRAMSRPRRDGAMQLFRSFDFGNLLRLNMLDERQYRSLQPCRRQREEHKKNNRTDVWRGKAFRPELCREYRDEDRTMLGQVQEAWLEKQISQSQARWNIVAQGVMVAELDQRHYPGGSDTRHKYVYSDTWSGYPAARDRLLQLLAQDEVSNPLLLSGDVHAFFANELKAPRGADQPVAGLEFVTGGISAWIQRNEKLRFVAESPCNEETVKYANLDSHGFSVCELTEDAASLWFVGFPHSQGEILKNPQEKKRVLASFTVESGSRKIKIDNSGTSFEVDNTLQGCKSREK